MQIALSARPLVETGEYRLSISPGHLPNYGYQCATRWPPTGINAAIIFTPEGFFKMKGTINDFHANNLSQDKVGLFTN